MAQRTRAIWLTEAEWEAVITAISTVRYLKTLKAFDGRTLERMESAKTKIEQAAKGVS